MRRREFVVRVATSAVGLLAAPGLMAQSGAPAQGTTSNLFDMNQEAAKTVRRPPKAGAVPSMSADARDALEHELRCQ